MSVRELAATLTEHEGKDIRRPDPLQPVWDVRDPWLLSRNKKNRLSRVAACRSAAWRALLSSGVDAYIHHHEAPGEYEVTGSWQQAGNRTWRIPTGFDPAEASTSAWLFLGGWIAYAAAAPVENTHALFRLAPERVTEWAERHQIVVAIESFFDDREWRVCVRAPRRDAD